MSGLSKFPRHTRQLSIRTMMILVAVVAIYLWLVMIFPAILIISAVWAPSGYFARRLINRVRSEGHIVTAQEKFAAFLAVSLFCVPITTVVLGSLRAVLATYCHIYINLL